MWTAAALSAAPTRGQGCVAADFDNDGHTDVLVTGIEANLMLRNLGNGRFVDVTRQAGLEGYGWQTAAAVADVDGDGLLDIYVGRFIEYRKGGRTYEPGSQYKQDVAGSFNSALYPAQANSLYRNRGDWRFEDVAQAAGVANPDGRTLGALWLDLDADERPDLIVANAAGTGSTTVFRNEGKWRFKSLGPQTRLQSASGARAVSAADLDNDGSAEILLTAINGAQSGLFVRESPASADPVFIDRARQWSMARDEYSGYSPWSALAADFDNDGWLDVLASNGLIVPDADVPRLTVGQAKQLWLNNGRGALRPQELGALEPLLDRQSARGTVAADFDNDGDIDVYVAHNNDLGQLLINRSQSAAHWVGFKLADERGNRQAIGARVELRTSSGAQYRWITSGAGFLSGSDPRAHFGLGAGTAIGRVIVTWPDGATSTFKDVPVDRYVELKRGARARAIEVAPTVSSRYGALSRAFAKTSEARLRSDYLQLLVAARGLDDAIAEVRESLADADTGVRKASVDLLARHPGPQSLVVLLDALSDTDPTIVRAAVDAVCPYEEEMAMRWLLRLFAHPDAEVRTALAQCLASYYREEEAVVHRKYLAVPYLVAALGDASEQVQIAAADALANAERYRGVPALLELARGAKGSAVRAAAVRAVGLIRDRQGMPGLLGLLRERSVLTQPDVLAQLLIALKRLDYAGLSALTANLGAGRGEFAGIDAKLRLATLREMLLSPDGVVFARAQVAAVARRCYASAGSGAAEATTLAYVDVLRLSGSPTVVAVLSSISAGASSGRVKAAALHALAEINPAKAARYIALPDRRVRSAASAEAVLQVAASPSAVLKDRVAALDALTRSAFKPRLPPEMFATADDDLGAAIARYELSRLPSLLVARKAPPAIDRLLAMRARGARFATLDVLASRREFWAKAVVLRVLRENPDQQLRAHALELLGKNGLQASRVLEAVAGDAKDPLRSAALGQLEAPPGSSAELLLLKVLRDAAEDPRVRIVAAHRLVGRLGPQVIDILEEMT